MLLRRCVLYALFPLCLLVSPTPGYSLPVLTITGGGVTSSSMLRDSFFNFGGEGFHVEGGFGSHSYPFSTELFLGFINSGLIVQTTAVVDGVGTCLPVAFPDSCGTLTITQQTANVPTPDQLIPFTAKGTLAVQGQQFDLVGQGTVSWVSSNEAWTGNYRFTAPAAVPEPATMLLSLIGFVCAYGHRRIRFRRI